MELGTGPLQDQYARVYVLILRHCSRVPALSFQLRMDRITASDQRLLPSQFRYMDHHHRCLRDR